MVFVENVLSNVDVEAGSDILRLAAIRCDEVRHAAGARTHRALDEAGVVIQELAPLHHHLADGVIVVGLLMGLVHCYTYRPGAWKAGGGQSSSGQRYAIRVVRGEKSLKSCVGDTYR